ncbi:MAG: hypothetical protein HY961_04215 [Ignavibacteriae bacterium]|nr:hypothetical protein [Ignavibacteriota bacterium]
MNAIEFTTTPQAGVITIPQEYRDEIEGEVRVIVLKENDKKTGVELRKELEAVFEKYKGVTPFQGIDPVEWQREQRREWH